MNSATTIKSLTVLSLGVMMTVSLSAFAQNFTDVPTPLDSSNPTYPLSTANSLQGWFQQLQTLTDMYNIPVAKLTRGMLVYVVATDKTYRLMTSPTSIPTSASDRVAVAALSDGSGAGLAGGGVTCADPISYYLYYNTDIAPYYQWQGQDPRAAAKSHRDGFGWKEGRQSCRPIPGITGLNAGGGSQYRAVTGSNTLTPIAPYTSLSLLGGVMNIFGGGLTMTTTGSYNVYSASTYNIAGDYGVVEYAGYPACSCDTSPNSTPNCSPGQSIANPWANYCTDYLGSTQVQICTGDPYYGEFCYYDYVDKYQLFSVGTTQGSLQSTVNYSKNIISATGSNLIQIWNSVTYTSAGVSTTDKTTTRINGDVEMKNLPHTTTINSNATNLPNSLQSLVVDGNNGKLYRWARKMQTFTQNVSTSTTANLWTIEQWFCYVSQYYHNSQAGDSNANIEPGIRVYLDGNQWKMYLKVGVRVRWVEWAATCVWW
jgi:hypothetical protein